MVDGADRTPYLSRLVAALARRGVTMHYAADPRYKDFAALEAAGVTCHAFRNRHKLDPRVRWFLRRLLDEHGIEIVHTIAGRDSYQALKARRRRDVRVLVRRGAYSPISRFDPSDRTIYGRRGGDRFILVSRDLARHMEVQGLAADRIAQIYTGIWSPELDVPPAPLDAPRPVLLLVGALRPVKGFDYLLDALAQVDRPFHLVVAGRGYEKTVPEIGRRGLADRVTLLGHVPDPIGLVRAADVMVMPSRIDALPRAVIEATVVGTPVVATRVGGIPEILDEGRGGRLVDPADPRSLAETLTRDLDDPAPLRALAEHAQARNRELFGLERCADIHVALYEGALAG